MKPLKLFMITIGIICITWTFWGCPDPNPPMTHTSPSDDLDPFPDFLVGSWKADHSRWVLTFNEEGELASMTHFGGMQFDDFNQGSLTELWRENIEAVYILGPCEIKYNPNSRQLYAHINIEHFRVSFPDTPLEGSFDDIISGPILPDNQTWKTTWRSTGTIVGSDPVDPNDITLIKVETFRKIIPGINADLHSKIQFK